MDHYDGAYEKLKDIDNKRENVDLDDFEEFMRKVEEVNKMVHALTSNNKSEIEEASKKAAVWLKSHSKKKRNIKEVHEEIINDLSCSSQVKKPMDKTIINKKANNEKNVQDLNNLNSESMSQEAFMKSVEEDAKKRSEDRKERKIKSDELKEKAKEAFLENDFEKALDWYNKAIEVRKDSYVLYVNRALTLLKLGLNSRALNDCENALKLNENNFKCAVYKAKAYFQLKEDEKLEKWLDEVKKMFPNRVDEIVEYQKSWNENSDED